MNRSSHTPISDELLSAYIDGVVTNEEKATVEAAIAADPLLAWELESLRQTVDLVRNLPPIPLPRSFALTEEQVADVLAERRARATPPLSTRASRPAAPPPRRNFWQDFLAFFNSGNLILRNAAALAALFFVIVLVTSPTANSGVLQSGSFAPASDVPSDSAPDTQAEQSAPAAAESAMASAENAPEAAQPEPMIAPAVAAQEESLPAVESRQPETSRMEISPENRVAPQERMTTGIGGGPVGGGQESGPAALQAGPASLAPASEMPPPAAGVDSRPGYFSANPGVPESSAPAVAASAADSAAEAPVAEKAAMEETAAAEAVAEDAVVEDVTAEDAVALKSAPAEAPAAPAQAEVSIEPQAATPVSTTPSLWLLAQIGLGGLVLLLAFLWLRSRQPSP